MNQDEFNLLFEARKEIHSLQKEAQAGMDAMSNEPNGKPYLKYKERAESYRSAIQIIESKFSFDNPEIIHMADEVNLKQYGAMEVSLRLLLDQIDYVAGNCRANEMIGAVLPASLLSKVKLTLFGLGPEDMKNDITYPPDG